MFDLAQLKQEARKLLDRVNHNIEHSLGNEPSSFDDVVDRAAFNSKIKNLRQEFRALRTQV
jgi:hypothetical protein